MNWEFKENSILKNYSEHTLCKDIFHAVCDEIGKYYINKGWKYARSRPKITFKSKEVKIEIAFWSSGSNTPGSYVNLEVLPIIYSTELVNKFKSEGIKSKGYILGFLQLFNERFDNQKEGSKRIINILSDNINRMDENDSTPEIKFNKNINVYGINENDFSKIIDFIDDRIACWIDKINKKTEIDEFLNRLTDYNKSELLKGDFGRFLKLKFPNN